MDDPVTRRAKRDDTFEGALNGGMSSNALIQKQWSTMMDLDEAPAFRPVHFFGTEVASFAGNRAVRVGKVLNRSFAEDRRPAQDTRVYVSGLPFLDSDCINIPFLSHY